MYQAHMEPEYPKLNTWQLPGTTAWLIDTSDILQSVVSLLYFRSSPAKMVYNMSIPSMSKIVFHLSYTALKCWELSCGSKTLLIVKEKRHFGLMVCKKKKRRHNLSWHTPSSYAFLFRYAFCFPSVSFPLT